MAYVKTVWATGDVITATKLNNAELGIETIDTELTTHEADNSHKYARSFLLMGG